MLLAMHLCFDWQDAAALSKGVNESPSPKDIQNLTPVSYIADSPIVKPLGFSVCSEVPRRHGVWIGYCILRLA